MAGDLGFGYSGSTTDPGQSSHGTNITGTGYLKGYYYDPKFVTFRVQPSYGRNQDNSDLQSIFDTGSVSANAALLGGSNFPGNIVFTKTFNSAGQFGIPGASGLITKSDSQAFAINWHEQVPDWPTLSLGFSDSSGKSSLLGTSEESHSSMRAYSLRTGYELHGFSLGGDVTHNNSKADSFLLAGAQEATDTSSNSYGVSVAHSLPLHGYFSTRYSRSDYNGTVAPQDSKYYGTADNISSTLGFVVKVPVTITANYTDDVFGSIQQYLLNTGTYVPLSSLTPKSSQLALSASSQYVWHAATLSGYVNHIEQSIGDNTYSTTQGGGTVGYNFARFIKGLFVSAGVVDTANENGNQRAALIGSVNYGHYLGRWGFNANFSYDQSTNTVGIVYTNSSMNYLASIGRRFSDRLRWSASFSGGHSGIEQQAGNGTHSEGFYSYLSWRAFTASGTYSQSGGTSLLTQSGLLQPMPLPATVFGGLTNFSARSVGGGVSLSPMRKLSINGSYSRSNSNTQNFAVTSTNVSDQI